MHLIKKLLPLLVLVSINTTMITPESTAPIDNSILEVRLLRDLLLRFAQAGGDHIKISTILKMELAPLHDVTLNPEAEGFGVQKFLTRNHWEKVKKISELGRSFDKDFIDELVQNCNFLVLNSLNEDQLKSDLLLFRKQVLAFCNQTDISTKNEKEIGISTPHLVASIKKMIKTIEKEVHDPSRNRTVLSKITDTFWGSRFSYKFLPQIILVTAGLFEMGLRLLKRWHPDAPMPAAPAADDNAEEISHADIIRGLISVNNRSNRQDRQDLLKILLAPTLEFYRILQSEDYELNQKRKDAELRRRQTLHDKKLEKHITFSNIIGYEKEKKTLKPVITSLSNPLLFKRFGSRTPSGVFFSGPPGIGKTLFMHAIAGEAGCPYWYLSCGDLINSKPEAISNIIEKIFYDAETSGPSILIIDELDFIGNRKNTDSNNARKIALSKLLTKLNNFRPKSPYRPVIVIAAANNPEDIDPALIRCGRFDFNLRLSLPDSNTRKSLFEYEIKSIIPTEATHLLEVLDPFINATEGYSHAAISVLVHNACRKAANRGESTPLLDDFEEAFNEMQNQ